MSLLEVQDLHTSFFTDAGEVKAVNGVSFFLDKGKVLGIVGESGSGKSVTAYSIMQILASTGKIVSGSIKLDGQELVGAGEDVMKHVRGPRLSARQSRKPSRTSCSRILAQSATGCFSPSMNRSGHPRLQSSM